MKSTQLPLSNEKQRVELPTTTALYPTGTTINNAGKPLVYHPQAGKMSVGEFPTPDDSNFVHKTGNEFIAGTKTFTTSIIAEGDTDPYGITAPFILRAANGANQVAATMILDAELIGGKKLTFGSTGAQTGDNAGNFALYNATDGRYMLVVSSTGAGKFFDSVEAPAYKINGKPFVSYKADENRLVIGHEGDSFYTQTSVATDGFFWYSPGAYKGMQLSRTGTLNVDEAVLATSFIGDGSRLTNLPTPRVKNAALFTAGASGAQVVPLSNSATGIISVQLLETGTSWTRTIWEPYCTVSGTNLQITADALVRPGDKILVKYTY